MSRFTAGSLPLIALWLAPLACELPAPVFVAKPRSAVVESPGTVLDAGVLGSADVSVVVGGQTGAPPDADVIIVDPGTDPSGTVDSGEQQVEAPPADAGTAAPDPCSSYPYPAQALLDERLGFGAATTGGDPSRLYHVTTLAADGPGSLRAALESVEPWWIVFDVEGTISIVDREVRVASNKTVDGRGRRITLDARLRLEGGASNVIISDVRLTHPGNSSADLFQVRGTGGAAPADFTSRNFWIHQSELFHGGDGLIDLRGATQVTISWSRFRQQQDAILLGSDDDGRSTGGMQVTLHHNFFDQVTRHGPLIEHGLLDFFNNYQYRWFDYGAASLEDAQLLSEANIYEAMPGTICNPQCQDPNPFGGRTSEVSKDALLTDLGWSSDSGYARSVNDLLLEGAEVEINQPQRVFSRSTYYLATPDPADEVLRDRLRTATGPRIDYCRN